MLPVATRFYERKGVYASGSALAQATRGELQRRLSRGETVYLAGIGIGGFHNTGIALVEVGPDGLRPIFNNEEERFSGRKHTSQYPAAALEASIEMMNGLGIEPGRIVAWLATWDHVLWAATSFGTFLEEFPWSLQLLRQDPDTGLDMKRARDGLLTPSRLGQALGTGGAVPIIGMPHHDNHAAFSYLVSPFACHPDATMVLVADGGGDCASVSRYIGSAGTLSRAWHNGSRFDSLGEFYSVISSTQGGWTMLSSEGRYMGAAAYGDMDRDSNRYYGRLKEIFRLEPDGSIRLNRALANWHRATFTRPYTSELVKIMGPPIARERMWDPNAVLCVDGIRHEPHTQERVDKAAATQLVFEDALMHMVDAFIHSTGSSRLVLTGGTALNAAANMRLLERFDEDFYARELGRKARLHLWVPPAPNDSGVTLGAAYAFALSAGATRAHPLKHAFYCGRAASSREILDALCDADDLEWEAVGDASCAASIRAFTDMMAAVTVRDGIIALMQGPSETGPRALGHRSILANPCNVRTRELINERVKYREAIRPLAPMATMAAARELFELSDGASDDDYNAYNYMVLTLRAKRRAYRKVPAVIHVDGTARLQIVREETDPIAHAYLKALGRRTGVEVAVNTSFNVGAPIAHTPAQAVETLRRAKCLDAAFVVSADGPVIAIAKRGHLSFLTSVPERLARPA
ncbi:MAG TPA: carbamoyltransferase C-terminal domain-containing protein [Xanthobacteraceae bacterium]|nr:carbamoyltransferase C-terminal domain-containing protein [Xanthobacteraceae bacterium]